MAINEEMLKAIENPRVPGLARYQDLDSLVGQFFSDGEISDAELSTLEKIDDVLTSEFRVAQEYLSKMDPKSPLYSKAQDLLKYLYRCRNLIDNATEKAKIYNQLENDEKMRLEKRSRNKEDLNIDGIGQGGLDLVLGLMTAKQRIQAEESFSKKKARFIDPAEREAITQRLVHAMQTMRETQVNAFQMNKLLGLGREL